MKKLAVVIILGLTLNSFTTPTLIKNDSSKTYGVSTWSMF